MRRATATDLPAITDFLRSRVEGSMFPLANLANHGPAETCDHPRAMRFWLAGDPLTDVMGVTAEGMALPQLTSGFTAAARAIAGLHLMGMAGDAAQVRALRSAAGLDAAPTRLDEDEPQFALMLDRLVMPDCAGLHLAPLTDMPRDLLHQWRADYEVEVLGATPEQAKVQAVLDVDGWIAAASHRVLFRGGQPVSMTGFNARLPDIVQVGAVWTPPALRGQGLARRTVALHLAEARAEGATRATLFSASAMATRAYTAIGFTGIGRFALILFDGLQEVRPV